MEDFFFEYGGWIIVAIVAIVVIGMAAAVKHDMSIFDRNMGECMADGHKEYECRGILENRHRFLPYGIK